MHVEDEVPERSEDAAAEAEAEALESIAQYGMLELIDRLSPEQRQVLTLKFYFGFGNAESAAILGKTEGAVKSLQHRALAALERQLVHA